MVKIDIEGGEARLFEENLSWIDRVIIIIVELHDWLRPGTANLRNCLKALSERNRVFVFAGENVLSVRNRNRGRCPDFHRTDRLPNSRIILGWFPAQATQRSARAQSGSSPANNGMPKRGLDYFEVLLKCAGRCTRPDFLLNSGPPDISQLVCAVQLPQQAEINELANPDQTAICPQVFRANSSKN